MAGPTDDSTDTTDGGETDGEDTLELTDEVRSMEPQESDRSDVRSTQKMEAVAPDDLDDEPGDESGDDAPSAAVVTPRGGTDTVADAEDSDESQTEEDPEQARHERVLKTIQMKAVDRSMIEREGQVRQLEGTLPLLSNRFAPDLVVSSPEMLVRNWTDEVPGEDAAAGEQVADEQDVAHGLAEKGERETIDVGPAEPDENSPDDAEEPAAADAAGEAAGGSPDTPTEPPDQWSPPDSGSEETVDSSEGRVERPSPAAPQTPPDQAGPPDEAPTASPGDSGGTATVESDRRPPEADEPPPKPEGEPPREESPTGRQAVEPGEGPGEEPPEIEPEEEPAEEPPEVVPEEIAEAEDERAGLGGTWIEEAFGEEYLMTLPSSVHQKTQREADFIEKMLSLQQGDQILDLACGYGRHTVELAERGYDIAGFDLSQPLLEKALAEAKRRSLEINFFLGDMRGLTFADEFDACFCWQTSFGYYPDRTNLEILARINRSLRTGGRFLLDVMNRDFVVHDMPHRRWWEGTGCVFLEEGEFDDEKSVLHLNRKFVLDERELEHDYYIRLYSRHELAELLDRAGFRVHDVTGDLAHPGYFLGAESQRLIIRAEKVTSVLD
ncbi:MAG: class I SAM-dependent methyltransferase [Bradymonadaceae bacterium]